ncbi:MAG: glycosyltransferase family 1 protein [Patescibacteria group bacterium]
MRIGIDCRTILNPGYGEAAGVGHYTFFLVSNLLKIDKENEYVLFFDSLLSKDAAEEMIADAKNVKIEFFPFHQYKHYLPFAFSHLLTAGAIEKEKLDVFHSPAYTLPLAYRGKSIVTVHDLAIYKNPKWFPGKFLTGQSFSTKTLVPKSLKKAKKIIAVSKNTKKDITEIFKINPEKVEVIYEGVEFRNLPKKSESACGIDSEVCFEDLKIKYGLKDDYVLFLGTIEPRKNIAALVRAFCDVVCKNKNLEKKYQLVLAGARGWKYKDVFKEIEACQKKLGTDGEIKYIGYVPGREKFTLIKGATCFVFPSFYEGFGLSVLEALSLGVPTITSNKSSLSEIAGQAAMLVDPEKASEISEALEKILTDKNLREELGKGGINQAGKFSWKKCAEETLDVYKKVVTVA